MQYKQVLNPYISKVVQKENLTYDEAYRAMTAVLNGEVTDEELANLLIALNEKGEVVDELHGICQALLDQATRLEHHIPNAIDNCGTGGDQSKSFNISTTAAFVMSAAGATVAKHGNRSITSLSGSADLLSTLGISIDFDPFYTTQALENIGIAFMFAPQVHKKMGQIMRVRNALKRPTLFNLIGPLINPVKLDYQYTGVFDRSKLTIMAEVAHRLGRKKAIFINGANYMDEASLSGDNHLVILENGEIRSEIIHPEMFHLEYQPQEALIGGDSQENAQITFNILNNKGTQAQHDVVALNAGIGLYACEQADSIEEGIAIAKECIESGRAKEKLNHVIQYQKEATIL